MAKALPAAPAPLANNGYNVNPAPQIGSSAFGAVPGNIGAPPSIYQQLQSNVPNYASLTGAGSADIGNELAGTLSPGTQNLLQNKAAAFGVNIGMPGGAPGNTLTTQNLLDNMGLTSEGLTHQGLADYGNFTSELGSQQQSPELLSNIAEQNAVNAAAPNPAAAAQYAQSLFDKYLNQGNPAGSTPAPNYGRLVGGTPQNGTWTMNGTNYYG